MIFSQINEHLMRYVKKNPIKILVMLQEKCLFKKRILLTQH